MATAVSVLLLWKGTNRHVISQKKSLNPEFYNSFTMYLVSPFQDIQIFLGCFALVFHVMCQRTFLACRSLYLLKPVFGHKFYLDSGCLVATLEN